MNRPDTKPSRKVSLKLFGLLMGAALLGFLAVTPYLLTLVGSQLESPIPLGLLLLLQAIQHLILVALATGLGL